MVEIGEKCRKYPEDQRRVLVCGIPDGNIHVECLPAVAPGVDSQWEMRLYGLVKTDAREYAIQFLEQTYRMSREDAASKVRTIAAELGIR